jgi:hypothetical protein
MAPRRRDAGSDFANMVGHAASAAEQSAGDSSGSFGDIRRDPPSLIT